MVIAMETVHYQIIFIVLGQIRAAEHNMCISVSVPYLKNSSIRISKDGADMYYRVWVRGYMYLVK